MNTFLEYTLICTPYGIFTSGTTAQICTETPNFEDTLYTFACMQKIVNGTPDREATRGALDTLYLDQGIMINEYELHLTGSCGR